jgi:hypothetical protein
MNKRKKVFANLLQMLVGSGNFVIGSAVKTQRLSCVIYWYIAENSRTASVKMLLQGVKKIFVDKECKVQW